MDEYLVFTLVLIGMLGLGAMVVTVLRRSKADVRRRP